VSVTLDDVVTWADVYLLPIGIKILFALIIFLIGRTISRAVLRALDRVMERSKMDISLRKFLGDVVYAVLFVVLVVLALDTVGIKIGPYAMVDMYGTPHSPALHVVERYRLLDYEDAKDAI